MATLLILVATLYPSSGSFSFSFWEYDKLGHFIMFAVWTFLYGLYRASKSDEPPNLWIVFILGSFYGLIIEFLQFLVPTNRNPEAMDLVADIFGAMAAIILLRILFQSIIKDRSNPTA